MMLTIVDSAAPGAEVELMRVWDTDGCPLVVDAGMPAMVRAQVLADAAADQPGPPSGAVVATSGTTGSRRFVELSSSALTASASAVNAVLGVDPARDQWLCIVPLSGVAGLAIVRRAYESGTALAVHHGFDPGAVVADRESTIISVVPTTLSRLLDAEMDWSSYTAVLVGGDALPPALRERARTAGVPLHTSYGMTETGGGCVHDGHPLPGVEIAIGAECEVLVRGPVLMDGYRNDDAATAAAIDPAGWLHTGDAGAFDATGELRITDRLKDVIVTGGVNVSPTAVETALLRDGSVADCAVAGVADLEWGERVVAFVVLADPAEPPGLNAVRDRARDVLAPAELPREVVVVESIPRSAAGKILRRLLPGPAPDTTRRD